MSLSLRNSIGSPNSALDDPLVQQLVTENELMLWEISMLKQTLAQQSEDLEMLRKKVEQGELDKARDVKQAIVESVEVQAAQRDRDTAKVALLRPILESLARFQLDMKYYADERNIDSKSEGTSGNSAQSSRPHSLSDMNEKFEQLYHLISSYQATPSFMSSPYDSLVLDAFGHIIALSKTMNAMACASMEREAHSVADSTANEDGGQQRSSSIWSAFTRKSA